jgi:hypothetical protein
MVLKSTHWLIAGKLPNGPWKNCGATVLVPGQVSERVVNRFPGLASLGDRTEGLKSPAVGAANEMGKLDAKRLMRRDLMAMAMDICWKLVELDFQRRSCFICWLVSVA